MVAILAGMATATLIYLHPEHLRVPAWVAYSACLAFVLGGLALLAQSSSGRPVYRWLVAALVGAMLVPPLWAAAGAGTPTCSAAMLGIPFFPSEVTCRAVWGSSALVLFGVFILVFGGRWRAPRRVDFP